MTPAFYFTTFENYVRVKSNVVILSTREKAPTGAKERLRFFPQSTSLLWSHPATVPIAPCSGLEIDSSTVNTSFSPNTGCMALGKLLNLSPSISSSENVDAKVLPHMALWVLNAWATWELAKCLAWSKHCGSVYVPSRACQLFLNIKSRETPPSLINGMSARAKLILKTETSDRQS